MMQSLASQKIVSFTVDRLQNTSNSQQFVERVDFAGQEADTQQATATGVESAIEPVDPGVKVSFSATATEANVYQKPQNYTSSMEQQLTESELSQVKQLQLRDLEVRQHELAHSAAGGSRTGSPAYEYETGPDGKRYVVNGEVPVAYSGSSDPNKQIEEAKQIKQAATAPVDPSAQDRAVARQADQKIAQAQQALLTEINSQTTADEAITTIDLII